jgi:hypothetical protein
VASDLLYTGHSDSADVRTWSRRLNLFVQIAKLGLLALLLFVVVRYAGAYHRAMEFNHYVQEEVTLTNSDRSLKEILLIKAEQDHLPITGENIDITKNGPELRVSVEYQVPLDLILVQKPLTFHSTGVRID